MSSVESDHERPTLCEALTIVDPSPDGTDGALSPDDYTRCSNDVAGHYRIAPDAGETVDVWLCATHAATYESHVVEVLDEV